MYRGQGMSGRVWFIDRLRFSTKTFNTLLVRLEAQQRAVAAPLHGTVLGGRLELAMACHDCVARPDARFGLHDMPDQAGSLTVIPPSTTSVWPVM